jgi:aldose 1-epimerase
MEPPPLALLDPARFVCEVEGRPTALYRLHNARGMEVAVTNLGAKVLQIVVPDRHGVPGDVALGYESIEAVLAGAPSMGAFIGRYAGRIALACFTLDGVEHQLTANDGPHCMHGGPGGTRHRVFEARQTTDHTLELHHRFTPGNDGFPGTLDLRLSYHLSERNELVIEHEATAIEGSGPASFTSHVFFNLDGPGHTTIDGHRLEVQASHLLATDVDHIATGERTALQGHPLDLRTPQRLGELPDIDHAYQIDTLHQPASLRLCARASSTASGRTLEVWSTEPVLQVYTAGQLGKGEVPDTGKQGVRHRPRAGLCLEPQQYPNAPNCPAFPLNRVAPERPYRAQTRYRFGVSD